MRVEIKRPESAQFCPPPAAWGGLGPCAGACGRLNLPVYPHARTFSHRPLRFPIQLDAPVKAEYRIASRLPVIAAEATHVLHFRSIGSTRSASIRTTGQYHVTGHRTLGESATACIAGRRLRSRMRPSLTSARNDAEKSHQTDFSRRVCGYRRAAGGGW
jgi:hypothetical protein